MTKLRVDVERRHDAAMDPSALAAAASRALGTPLSAIRGVEVVRRALDARRQRSAPTWLISLDVDLDPSPQHLPKGARAVPPPLLRLESPRVRADAPPVAVVGAGPAGLFAATHLAEHGARVILVERGKPVETRARDFGRFRGRAELDPESNLCFGEGGAGTYSDGKLTCRKNDPLVREVLERLVAAGAPPRILVDAKPHIGTNLLFGVLKGLRARLLELGVTIHFQSRFEGLITEGGAVRGLDVRGPGQLDAPRVLLAIGHSARDTFERLLAQGVPMEVKPFAVGVRAEHPQRTIDAAQYHLRGERPATLPAADYRLAHTEAGRGIYSFCMCPGGMIVPTSTEPDMVVVNGMSTARRSSPFANSGVVVQVELADLEREGFGAGPLAGVELQRALERRAFDAGGRNYRAPAIRSSDFLARRAAGTLADSHFRPGLEPADLEDVLPGFVTSGLRAALAVFDHKLSGYVSNEANLIAVESRTSSPLRIPRDPERFEVPGFSGLFVAGEGPGYAGGIMSAAMDGLRAAQAILRDLAQSKSTVR